MHHERRAVIIDDDSLLCRLLQRRLHRVGIEPYFTHSGGQGLSTASRVRPDVILLDVHLPDTDGFDVCRLLKAQSETADIPVIMMTASGDLHARAFDAGAADCITKPISGEELDARVAMVLRRHAPDSDKAASNTRVLDLVDEAADPTAAAPTESGDVAMAAVDEVLAVIGHELRTPLSGIRVMAEYLVTEQRRTGEPHKFLVSIHDQVLRMATMVNNLLESARINSGMARWNWAEASLSKICSGVTDVLCPLGDREVISQCAIDPEDLIMKGDADAVQRLLINLVSNAQKYASTGSIRVEVEEDFDASGRWIVLHVIDTGKGMPPDVVARLGVPFALNGGVAGLNQSIGCGLGLSICKSIAAAHGGSIDVQSELGKGTTVTARLRADLPEPIDLIPNDTFDAELAA